MFSSYHALRLVCRAFRDLLTSPLWLYMTKEHISGVMQVPLLVRAVYIPVWANSACNFHRIITSRTPYRIVSLDIQCDYITDSSGRRALSFDSLCRGSDKLTGIRYLALQPVLHGDGLDIEFWKKLNDCFPYLSCLKLSAYSSFRGFPNPVLSEDQPLIVFENLRVLIVSDMDLRHLKLRFPILGHAFLEFLSREVSEIVVRRTQLPPYWSLLTVASDERCRRRTRNSTIGSLTLVTEWTRGFRGSAGTGSRGGECAMVYANTRRHRRNIVVRGMIAPIMSGPMTNGQ